jgi:hypothetical protein
LKNPPCDFILPFLLLHAHVITRCFARVASLREIVLQTLRHSDMGYALIRRRILVERNSL